MSIKHYRTKTKEQLVAAGARHIGDCWVIPGGVTVIADSWLDRDVSLIMDGSDSVRIKFSDFALSYIPWGKERLTDLLQGYKENQDVSIDQIKNKGNISVSKCTCAITDLMRYGCKCGGE
jgi:hypothetical protein